MDIKKGYNIKNIYLITALIIVFFSGCAKDSSNNSLTESPLDSTQFFYMAPGVLTVNTIDEFPKKYRAGDRISTPIGEMKNGQSIEINKAYYIQTTEVTRSQYDYIMGDQKYYLFTNCTGECPVTNISYEEIQKFISKINKHDNTNKYRLPTEVEWEYAYQIGFNSDNSLDKKSIILDQHAWYTHNSSGNIHEVGTKKQNMNDMLGNAWEQTSTCVYKSRFKPKETKDCYAYVIRGGGAASKKESLTNGKRHKIEKNSYSPYIGFRLVKDI